MNKRKPTTKDAVMKEDSRVMIINKRTSKPSKNFMVHRKQEPVCVFRSDVYLTGQSCEANFGLKNKIA